MSFPDSLSTTVWIIAVRIKMNRLIAETTSMKMRILLGLIICCRLSAHAEERYEFYNGIRALGMGGASIAVVNDETALLVNPAALGKLRDYFITIIDPEIAVSQQTEEIAGTDILKMIGPQSALEKALVNADKRMHLRSQLFPSIVVPNFGFGLFAKYEVNSEFESTANVFKYDYTNDYAGVFGFNFRLFSGMMKLGASARVVNRVEIRKEDIDPTSTGLSLKTLASEGLGIASDLGLVITAPVALLPSIAGVYRDVGRTSYTFRDGLLINPANAPSSTAETIDVALSIHPIHGRQMRSTWTIEYRDVFTYGKETDQLRRTHAGVELNYADALFVRAGMNQRYWTAGLELAMFNYQFQAASYGEEVGTAAETREDRRYVVKFSFRF